MAATLSTRRSLAPGRVRMAEAPAGEGQDNGSGPPMASPSPGSSGEGVTSAARRCDGRLGPREGQSIRGHAAGPLDLLAGRGDAQGDPSVVAQQVTASG